MERLLSRIGKKPFYQSQQELIPCFLILYINRPNLSPSLKTWSSLSQNPRDDTPYQPGRRLLVTKGRKQTSCLEAVDWHYGHLEGRKGKPRYKKRMAFILLHVLIGSVYLVFDIPIYLREKTVRPLNREPLHLTVKAYYLVKELLAKNTRVQVLVNIPLYSPIPRTSPTPALMKSSP